MPRKAATHAQLTRGRRDTDLAYERRRRADPALRQAQRIRSSVRWQRFRRWFKSRHPLCCDPFGYHAEDGRVEPTEHAHHIVPLIERPDLACYESNVAPLCVLCHTKVEAMERRGKATWELFRAGSHWGGGVKSLEPRRFTPSRTPR